jgi:Chemotaxis response regulator containing a CheY-like receiver domain and a methylesterase domain
VIKLLIADDSALMRRVLEDIFLQEGDFDIRLARNGHEALELVRSFDPQVVPLDLQVPGMGGLTCLGRIMIEAPRPVVMISSLTAEGADATLEAIQLGAVDFVAKPSGTVSLEIDRLRPVLVEKCAGRQRPHPAHLAVDRARSSSNSGRRPCGALPAGWCAAEALAKAGANATNARTGALAGLVLIGTSTGGPAALDIVLPQLPADFPWPVLVAQHLPASFTGAFARRLDRECQLGVVEVDRPMPLKSGTIYIGRGDADVTVAPRAAGVIAMPAPARPAICGIRAWNGWSPAHLNHRCLQVDRCADDGNGQ